MDTAKVDIRKLQLLNDRINMLIDALSQVRQSVHGLQHTVGQGQGQGQQFGQGQQGQQGSGTPWQYQGAQAGQFGAQFGAQPFGQGQAFGQQTPWGVGGLSHTGAEQDPYRQFQGQGIDPNVVRQQELMRYAQTFPYAFMALAPVLSIY